MASLAGLLNPLGRGLATLVGTGSLSQAGQSVSQGVSDVGETLFGKEEQFQQIPRFSTEQLDFIKTKLLPLLSQQFSQMNQNQPDFGPIAQQARQQFHQQTVPSLAERFTALTGGTPSSPSFASQLGQAGAGLEGNLAALQSRFNIAQQGLGNQQLSTLLGAGLSPQFETAFRPSTQGYAQQAGGALMQALPYLLV